MENNGIFSNNLGLEISLNHHQTTKFSHQQPPFAPSPAPAKQFYPYASKQRASPISDEEEFQSNNLNFPATTDDSGAGASAGDGKMKKGSPWQRMKWTDNMVRLLIMVVFYVGDEVGSEQVHVQPPGSGTAVKKSGAGGVLQKKGKWKSVSKAMMERGFNVSPQQCEDKFNDLNKRYKRVNDILGKGTACKVVENQNLLESMDHIPAKLKEEVKKLLNSKHLFFREMCAYHNSSASAAATGSAGGTNVAHHCSPPELSSGEQPLHHQRQRCVHSNDEDDEEDDEEDEGDDDGDPYQHNKEEDDGLNNRKRSRTLENERDESVMNRFSGELSNVIQDLSKSVWEKRQWMKMKMMQLEEQRLGFEDQTYELEKRRLRWVKFCWSREREMEVEKVRNEKMKIENERMVILLRQKEIELVDLQQ